MVVLCVARNTLVAVFGALVLMVLLSTTGRITDANVRKAEAKPPQRLRTQEEESQIKVAELHELIKLERAENISADQYLRLKSSIMSQPQHHRDASLVITPVDNAHSSTSAPRTSALREGSGDRKSTTVALSLSVPVQTLLSPASTPPPPLSPPPPPPPPPLPPMTSRTVEVYQRPLVYSQAFSQVPTSVFAETASHTPATVINASRSGKGARSVKARHIDTAAPPPKAPEVMISGFGGNEEKAWRLTWQESSRFT